jgi:3-isopropylmalate/(R)-2-methylmalate dehydratase large subunit
MTQKILANHAGGIKVKAGDWIEVNLDLVLGNDFTSPAVFDEFERISAKTVFDRDKVVLVPDHFAPNDEIKAAQQCNRMRNFAQKHQITNYFEIGQMGVEHALLPEKGLVVAGDLVIGGDSHTCTYGALGAFSTDVDSKTMAMAMATGKMKIQVPGAIRFYLTGKLNRYVSGKDVILHIIGMIGGAGARHYSMEFGGEGVAGLTIDDRLTIANLAVEAGAVNSIFPVDQHTIDYLDKHSRKAYTVYPADEDADYKKTIEIDLSTIKPTVAFPSLPENTRTTDQIEELVPINQVVIGSCSNGHLSDFSKAAKIFEKRKVAKGVRVLIVPATQKIFLQCMELGYFKTFVEAGAVISPPTCGPCLGGHMGTLVAGERCVATTCRNDPGRMGHPESEVYLANPEVAAASAILGRLADPRELP